jgi:hypothetical protein
VSNTPRSGSASSKVNIKPGYATLRQWLSADGLDKPHDLLRPLIQSDVPEKAAESWTKDLPRKGWQQALLQLPQESGKRSRHRELLTLLLLNLAEEDTGRRETIDRWLYASRLLTWSGVLGPAAEEAVRIGVPSLGADPPKDEVRLGEALGRAYHHLLAGKKPLCLMSDAKTLSSPVEIAREGKDAEILALLRPVRWKLDDVYTRKSLHESRSERGLPPSVLLVGMNGDSIEAEREVRQVKTILETQFRKLDWPTSRIVTRQVKTGKELLRLLDDTRHGIVHLAGHIGQTGLKVGKERVDREDLARALATSDVRLLVLNGCSGAKPRSPLATGTITLADLLISRGLVPEVVAQRGPVQEDDAIAFAQRFYAEYLRDLDLGRAVHEARKSGSTAVRLGLVAVSQRNPESSAGH